MVNIGIFGATGYTGWELVQILQRHTEAHISFVTSESSAGQTLRHIFPQAPALELIKAKDAPLDEVDVVFLCLPHGAAGETAVRALNHNCLVIDLSADFRLKDAQVYQQWYGQPHVAPHLLPDAVYGLTEFARPALKQTRLVANPGCYTTTNLLALQPIMSAQIKVAGTVICDSKSGVSGAGRAPKANTHFVQVSNNFSPYKIGRNHRHLPEMQQLVASWHDAPPAMIFCPHLLPVPRGILSNIYVPLAESWAEANIRALYHETYDHEPFVDLLPSGELATLAHVTHTNKCAISITLTDEMLILTSATDNLIKGAAGQAVQNMNVALGFTETEGLL